MNFGNKEEFTSKSNVRIFSLAVFAILALMMGGAFAASTITGYLPTGVPSTTFSVVLCTSADAGNPCTIPLCSGSTLITNTSSTDSYTLTVSGVQADSYIYLCGTGFTKHVAHNLGAIDGTSPYRRDFGEVSDFKVQNVNADLNNYYVFVCDGATQLNSQDAQISSAAADEDYKQFYSFDSTATANNFTVWVDSDNTGACTVDADKVAGRHIYNSSNDVYRTTATFAPNLKTTGSIDADFIDGAILVQNTSGYAFGLTGDIVAGPTYTMYYQTIATEQNVEIYLFKPAGSFPDITAYDEKITGYTSSGAATFVNLNLPGIEIAGNVPSEVTTVTSTIAGKTYTVLVDTNAYVLYVPTGTTPTVLFKNSTGDTLFTYIFPGAIAADQTLSVGKVTGTVHANVTNVQIFEDTACSVTTNIQGAAVAPVSGTYTTYVAFDIAGAPIANFYPKVYDATYATCEPDIGAFGGTYAITANYQSQVSGKVSTGISSAGRVTLDLGGGFLLGADPYTATFSSGNYRLYVTTQVGAKDLLFYSDAFITDELSRSKSVTADTIVNVAQVDWTTLNVHADLKAGGAESNLRVYGAAEYVSSKTDRSFVIGASDSQFYEVPASAVRFEVWSFGDLLQFYVFNYTSTAGESKTYEPNTKVSIVAPAAIDLWGIVGSTFTYRDITVAGAGDIYVDKTEAALPAGYTYQAYDDPVTMLSMGSKDASAAGTFYVNTVTTPNIHADIDGKTDPVTVYLTAGTTADCSGTAVSSSTEQVWAAASKKYYETTLAGDTIMLSVTNGTYTSCVNTLLPDGGTGGLDEEYDLDVRTSGSVPSAISLVYIDANQAGGEDIKASTVAGTASTYAIYWAGDAASDISYYEGASLRLDRTGKNLGASVAINVGKVSGSSNTDLATVIVYSGPDCSTAVSSETVDPAATYAQYFEHTTNYVAVADATYTTCKRDALTVGTNQEAYENFDRKVSGTIPDISEPIKDLLSVKVIIPGTTNGYTAATVDGGPSSAYAIYVNSTMAATANSTITYHDALLGAGNTLLTLSKLLSADATIGVSAAYGDVHADLQSGSDMVAICYGTMPTSNADCSTKASTLISGMGAVYEIFFEQVTDVTSYYLRVLDVDTVNYYSWNGFTSGSAGTITQKVVNGKYSGSVRQAYDTSKTIGDVLILMNDDGGATLESTTYTYNDGATIAAPTGNFRMYGTSGSIYDPVFSKASYITQTVADKTLSTTSNVDLVSGIAIHVITQETGTQTNITTATVSILDCTDLATCNADTALGNVCTVAGVANQSCTITGDGTAGKGLTGMYYFAGIPDATKVKIKVVKSGYSTYSYPSAYDDPANNYYTTSSTVAISKTVEMTQATPACTFTAAGGSGTYTASGQLYTNASGVITFTMDCTMSGLTVTGDLSALGGSATQAFAASGTLYTYQLTISSLTTGTKTVTAVASTGSNSDNKSMSIIADVTAPTVSSSSPSTSQNTRSVTISATTDTYATCRYSTTDQAYLAMTSVMAGSDTLHEAMVLATNGATNHYYVRCIDLAGNAMASSTDISFAVDAVAPTIVSVTPAYSGTPYNSGNVGTIQIKTDVAANCKWSTTDSNYATMSSAVTATTANTYATLTGASAASGLNLLYVRCQTAGGIEMSSSGLISFNYDSTAPTYELTSVTSSGGMSSGSVVYAKATDVITVKFTSNEAITGTPTVTIGGAAMTYGSYLGGIFTYTRTLAGTEVTTAIIDISGGTDAAGNTATTYNDLGANAQFDFTAPTLTAPLPTTTQNSRSFTVSVNGGETGLTCRYSTNNVAFAAMEGAMADLGANVYSANAVVATEGSTTVYFSCRDLAGNLGTANTGAFTVDATAPTVTWVTPQGGYNSTSIVLEAYTDANANCAWDTQDGNSYVAMNYAFSTGQGTQSHSTTVSSALYQQGINHLYVVCEDMNGVDMTASVMAYFNYDTIAPSVYDWGYTIDRTNRSVKVWILSSEALKQSTLMMTFDGSNMSYFFGNGSVYTFNYTYGTGLAGVHNVTVSYCEDETGNACALEPVYFPIGITIDELAPTATAVYNSTNWMLSVTSSEDATCMYDYSNVSYGSMAYAMFGSTTAHTVMVHPYESSSAYYVYVRCSDTYSNSMDYSMAVDIHSDTAAPSIVNSAPSGIYTSLTAPTLEVNTSETATCQYKTSAFAWGSGTAMTNVTATRHTAALGSLADGTYSYYVLCQDTSGNTMASGFPVTFVVDTTGNFNYTYSLNLGWNSVWLPRIILQNLSSFNDSNYSTVNVLETKGNLTGNYNFVYYRNGTSCSSQNGSCWVSYDPTSLVNDLTVFNDWDNLPYWINMNATGKRLAYT